MRLTRLRWRLYGAWMWPTFVVLSVADGALTHWRPPAGDSVSAVGGALLGLTLSLIAIVLLAPPFSAVLRRLRPDMPKVVARDYGGAAGVALVTAGLLASGLAHRHAITRDSQALQDAVARAEAYIGDHAPARYLTHLRSASVDQIQPPEIYRVCVNPAVHATATATANAQAQAPQAAKGPYCVTVNRNRPFGRGVKYAGHEPNASLELGTN